MSEGSINLRAEMDAAPYGLVINLERRLRFGGKPAHTWGASVSASRQTKSGRPGKPSHILTIINDNGPAEALMDVVRALEHGEVELS